MLQEITVDSFKYALNENTNTYSIIKGPNNSAIQIPESVNGHIIDSISEEAFDSCSNITSLTISENVTHISHESFLSLPSLESIEVNTNNKKYNSKNNCNAIIKTDTEALILGCNKTLFYDGIKIIGQNAFLGCSKIEKIDLPDSVETIESDAFNGCSSLESINVGKGCKSIGRHAFAYCPNLKTIELPDSIIDLSKDFISDEVAIICGSEKVKKLVESTITNAKCYLKENDEYTNRLDNPHKVKFLNKYVDITNCSSEFIRDEKIYTDFDEFYERVNNFSSSITQAFSQLRSAKSFEDLFKRLIKSKNSIVFVSTLKSVGPINNFADYAISELENSCDDCDDFMFIEDDYKQTAKIPETINFDRMLVNCNCPEPPKITLTKVNTIIYGHDDYVIFDGYNPDDNYPIYFVYNNELWVLGGSWY